MTFTIITHVPHYPLNKQYVAYAPYVREMNLWLKYVDEVNIVAPLHQKTDAAIDLAYQHHHLRVSKIPAIQFTSVKTSLVSLCKLPLIIYKIYKACKKADHIHLRCPGNIGLLGCFVQILFPIKPKTAKYAGNWDPKAKQPLSYRLQKWLLSNTFLTKNMQVLVYGNWQNQTKNIKPFFTASYSNSEVEVPKTRDYSGVISFVFVGSLVEGKRPLLAIQLVEALSKQGKQVQLDLYGDGFLKPELEDYIRVHGLSDFVKLHGNQEKSVVKDALKTAHFLILLSKSEGWPKAIAEAMFFGTIPITTSVSCVPYMLNYGERGFLIKPELEIAIKEVSDALQNCELLRTTSKLASQWSQQYTLEFFEEEIKTLLS